MKIRIKKEWDRGRGKPVPVGKEIEVSNQLGEELIKKKIAEGLTEKEADAFDKAIKKKFEKAEEINNEE